MVSMCFFRIRSPHRHPVESNHKSLRTAYLTHLTPVPTRPTPQTKPIRPSRTQAQTPLTALANAATVLPGQYAAMRNVMREIRGRLGEVEWVRLVGCQTGVAAESGGGVVVWDGGMGSGVW
jgi:ribosomal protein RSM22 (predicted rRNA methylase)